jgi:precorrin-2 dehydrogenase/sirohydrochlorin ferrochelatase
MRKAPVFPIFLKLAGRRCLVVGGGKVSEGKTAGLIQAGAKVHVVAPRATVQIKDWHRQRKLRWHRREFRPGDLQGAILVVAATDSPKVHKEIFRLAVARRVLCNIVDVPSLCDFYYPAVVRRGHLQVAISTGGASPSLAKRLREEMESVFGPEYASWLPALAKERKKILAKRLPVAQRTELLKKQASPEALRRFLKAQRKPSNEGRVP